MKIKFIASIIFLIILSTQAFTEAQFKPIDLNIALKKMQFAKSHSGYNYQQIEKCLFPYISTITDNWKKLPTAIRRDLTGIFQRPTSPESWWYREGLPLTFGTPHFKFHYTLKGPDAVISKDISPLNGVPDFVDICAESFEKAYQIEVSQLGYRKPYDDLWTIDNGGDERYDVYLFSGPWLGFTMPEYPIVVHSTSIIASFYFGINSRMYEYVGDSEGKRYLETTCAHEFFHSIQFAYNYYSTRWFMESTCTLMERIVYDGSDIGETDGNNYYNNQLIYWFRYPDWSLTRFDGWHEYGSVIWSIFLTEKYGLDIIRDIFESMSEGTYRELSNFNDAFTSRNTNLASAFKEFTLWNYFTNFRYDDRFYSRGKEYPPIPVHLDNIHKSYPVKMNFDTEQAPENLGARYIRFLPSEEQKSISIKVDGSDIDDTEDLERLDMLGTRGWGAKLIIYQKGRKPRSEEIFLFRTSQEGQINISNFGSEIEEIVIILSNLHPDLDIQSISYSAGTPPAGKLSQPKLTSNDKGEVTISWDIIDRSDIKEVAVIRKRFAPSEGDSDDSYIYTSEVYSASDMDGDGIPDGNVNIIGRVKADNTIFIDNTTFNDVNPNRFGYDPQSVRYYYAIVPLNEYGIMGTPSIAKEGINPIPKQSPTVTIKTEMLAPGEWLVTLNSSHPLREPPNLISIMPGGVCLPIPLTTEDKKNKQVWQGKLLIKGFPKSGIYTYVVSVKGFSGIIGNTITEGGQFYYDENKGNELICFPNPFRPEIHKKIKFRPAGFKISIFTLTGELIKKLPENESEWDGKNEDNEIVSSGIYIYLAEGNDFQKTGKIAVLR